MIIALSNKKNAWILRQCQAAAFYQAENWSALYAIEYVVKEAGEDGEWDVVGRFCQLEQRFAGRSLDASDLDLFLDGLSLYENEKKRFEIALAEERKTDLLMQLRKMNWTHGEMVRISRLIARAIGENNPESIRTQFSELVNCGSGYEVSMTDVECFILGKDECDRGRLSAN
jgi:hypothetical protein